MPKNLTQNSSNSQPSTTYRKLNIFSMGGKGGVGKTTAMAGLAEWFEAENIPCVTLDLDTENRDRGGLKFLIKNATKVNVQNPEGLDVFFEVADRAEAVVLADMGASQGQVTSNWFDAVYDEARETGVGFLAVGLVTTDPGSLASVLQWAADLQDRVQYLIILNEGTELDAKFSLWEESQKAIEFRERFHPAVMRMHRRPAALQTHMNNHGLTLGQVIARQTLVEELHKTAFISRARGCRKRLFEEFSRVIVPFLPDL